MRNDGKNLEYGSCDLFSIILEDLERPPCAHVGKRSLIGPLIQAD